MDKLLVYATQHLETGGIESHLQEFCKNMAAAGFKIDLVILNASMFPETEGLYRSICHSVYLGRHGRSYKRLAWLAKVALQLSLNRYNALYTNGQGDSVDLFRKLTRYKNWVHHHHTSGDELDRATWTKAYITALHKANDVIACAKRNAADISRFLSRDIKTIPCFSRNIGRTNTDLAKSQKLNFGYFGRLIPEKGIDIICRLSQEPDLSQIQFNIWGEGPKYPASYFEQYPNINYRGTYKGLEGLTKAVNVLDAFLLLSTHPEGLPISLLEVMSAGIPWLATDKGGITDIACDPASTRIISDVEIYDSVKSAVAALAKDINEGKISKEAQMKMYQLHFASGTLVKQWGNILFKNKTGKNSDK